MSPHSTDLHDAATVAETVRILRNAAQAYLETISDLQSAWQDKNAGKVWARVAKELERAADRIAKLEE
jgi:hypothetical protein